MLGERNLLAASEGARARSIAYVNDCITMVKELGGEEISIVPGTVGKVTPDSTPENEWQWAVDSLKEIYEHGMASGVRLGIEPINIAKPNWHRAIGILRLRRLAIFKTPEHQQRTVICRGHCARAGASYCVPFPQQRSQRGATLRRIQSRRAGALIKDDAQSGLVSNRHR